jgi:cytochrome P450
MVPEAEHDPRKANLFGDLDPVHHAMQRRKYSSTYAMSSLIGYEPFVNDCCALLVHRFNEIATSHETVSLNHWLQCFAFDVVGYITFGGRFGLLDSGVDRSNILKAIEGRFFYSTFVGFFPYLHRFLLRLMPKTGGYGYMLVFSKQQMQDREKALKDLEDMSRDGPPDAMSKLLRAHEADPEKITKEDIFALSTTNIGAGADSTSITISTIVYRLIQNPSTYNRLQSEIDDAAREGKISDPITFKEAQELPYLQAVIKEALRIHPAGGLPLQRNVPCEGVTLAGHRFPGGSTVGIDAWVAHRNKSVYGSDAEIWRPERWLEFDEQGRGGEVEKYFFAFGMGSRSCIGKNISLLEMSKVIPQLLRNFDFVLDEGVKERGVMQTNRWFVWIKGFDGKILAREKREI